MMKRIHLRLALLALVTTLPAGPGAAAAAAAAPALGGGRPAAPAAASAAPDAAAPVVVLVTHPRASVLHYYETLIREHVWEVDNLHLVGVYHANETEDYEEARRYVAEHHLSWITLERLDCALTAQNMYADNPCREPFRRLMDASSGIIFNGGPDIPPSLYHRPTLFTTQIETPHRHIFEISLLFHLLGSSRDRRIQPLLAQRPDYAVLAICVGMQSMNVAAGGTLVQDIPSEIYHIRSVEDAQSTDPNTWHRSFTNELDPEPGVAAGVFHPIRLTPQAPAALRVIAGAPEHNPQVLSVHHQAVGKLAEDLLVTATSLDRKVVEGIRHRSFHNVIGWQFHPERPFLWDSNEIQISAAGAAQRNFGFALLSRDGRARAFNRAVWQQFAHDLRPVALPSTAVAPPATH